jgi:hypothetical protein
VRIAPEVRAKMAGFIERREEVDRPAVSFYALNGLDENPDDPNPFNIYAEWMLFSCPPAS